MLNISELHLASIIMDAAAAFIMAGMVIYTYIYRKRARFDDRIYFQLLIITMIMALSDAVTYVVDGSTLSYAASLSIIFNNLFFIAFELFGGLIAVYLYFRHTRDEALVRRRGAYIMIPALVSAAMILINNFTRFLYWISPSNRYEEYDAYLVIFIAPALYILFCAYLVIRIDAREIWLFFLLIFVRVFSRVALQSVSSTPVIFAMGLVFIHLNVMKEPFYESEEEA